MQNTKPATQDFITIKDIKDNVVIQDNGQMCMILLASSINFDLKSYEEQQAILLQFQQFINTLDFTLQIYVQSRRLNIDPYLELLASMESQQNNDLMRTQLREYIEFIRTFTSEVDIMSKNFFVVVPYTASKLSLSKGITDILSPKPKQPAITDEDFFQEQRIQLEQRVAVVSNGLSRIGVRSITLQKDDLVELFYHIYNPGDIKGSAPSVGQ